MTTYVTEDKIEQEREFAERSGLDKPRQSIHTFGSLCLITNNLSGPGMMGIPHLFHAAGLIPTTIIIILVFISSSLTGTFLADAVASIPGNGKFHRNVDFSKAFKLIAGRRLATIAEALFILACMSQACTCIVSTAQSLDSFLASFVIGKTYALQVAPTIKFLTWTPIICPPNLPTAIDCNDAPFSDDKSNMIISLGFVVVTMFLLPFGMGHLEETMIMQVVTFLWFFVFLAVFLWEFLINQQEWKGDIPFIGDRVWEVPGVVLFNYGTYVRFYRRCPFRLTGSFKGVVQYILQ
jgi:amino acid permease